MTVVSAPRPALAASAAGEYVALPPSRILDTRNGAGAVAAMTSIDVQVTGQGGVPTTNVVAVVVDLTAIPTGDGWGLMWQTGIPRPTPASTLNYVSGRPVTNTVTTQVSTAGKASYYSYQSSAHIIVDVVGYYRASPGGSGYNPLTQTRILDTRNTAKLTAGQTLDLRLRGVGGVPDSAAVTAVPVNLSAFEEGAGFVKVWPRGQAAPNTSNSTSPRLECRRRWWRPR